MDTCSHKLAGTQICIIIILYKKPDLYDLFQIMCFTAFGIVSLVTAIVSIQLLRLGLVNHTTEGDTYRKEKLDVFILVALGAAGIECLLSVVSSFVSCRLAKEAKKELQKKQVGTFHVQIVGEKEILVISSKKRRRLEERERKKNKGNAKRVETTI